MLIGLWVLTIFSWKISMSQMNPAVTLAFMFRNDSKKIHITMGLLMMGAQVAGAYCGALYWSFVSWTTWPMYPVYNDKGNQMVFQAMMQEIFGTFIFVLFFKIVTDERLHYSKENAINCFIIASAYCASRSIVNGTVPLAVISSYGACLNPAIAIGITLNSVINYANVSFKWFWLYWLMPFVGSIIAIVFYRFVYMKTQMMVMHDQQERAHAKEEHNEEQQIVQEYDNTMMAEQTKTLDE
jgi:glycerol uptake facilitator-like aquaporin